MSESSSSASSSTSSSTTSTKATAAPAPRWQVSDLETFASRWNTKPAVIRAAMRHAGQTDAGSPDEAKALVTAFLKQDVHELEQAQTDRLQKEAR